MKRIKQFILTMAGLGALMAGTPSHASTILMDFGDENQLTAGNWNNITNGPQFTVTNFNGGGYNNPGATINLIDSNGVASGMYLSVVVSFSAQNGNGITAGGPAAYPVNAYKDSLYGNTEPFQGGVSGWTTNVFPVLNFTNLNPLEAYTFKFYASRNSGTGDHRTTRYTLVGASTNFTDLDPATNTTLVATLTGIFPNSQGIIQYQQTPELTTVPPYAPNNQANHFTYLGIMEIDCRQPTTLSLGSSANPSIYGQSVALTATLTGGVGVTGETITFSNGVVSLGSATLNSSGVAVLNTSALPFGSDSIKAYYAGDAGNQPDISSALAQTVNQATVTPVVTVANKAYDASTSATISGRSLSGVVGGDDVNLGTSGSASFSDKNSGTGKTVNVTGLSLSGTTAGKYVLSSTTATTTANITQRALTVTATGFAKNYDATVNATVSLSDNRLGGDVLTDNYSSATFASKTVGTSKPITVTGISLSGTDAGNYTPNTTASASGTIFSTNLTVTGLSAASKPYDGTTTATIGGTATPNGIQGTDSVSLTGTPAGTFSDSLVGTNKAVTVSGLSLSGADSGNYFLIMPALYANITSSTHPIALGAYIVTDQNGYINSVSSGFTIISNYTVLNGGNLPKIVAIGSFWTDQGVWGGLNTGGMDGIRAMGSIPLFTWQSFDKATNYINKFPASQIVAGTYDSHITNFANLCKNWGHPFYLRFDHEMTGNWYPYSTDPGSPYGNSPTNFVKAWRHVHDIFTSVGATNVLWVWCPGWKPLTFAASYPGDAYVDWIALDAYNWGTNYYPHQNGQWQSLPQSFVSGYGGNDYTNVTALSTKPLMFTEFGCDEHGGNKGAWYKQTLLTDIPTLFPRVKAIIQFQANLNAQGEADWRIHTSTNALTNFQAAAQSPLYSGTITADLKDLADSSPDIVAETELAPVYAKSTTNDILVDANFSNGEGTILRATNTGDYVTFVVSNVPAATYDVFVGVKNINTRGQFQTAVSREDTISWSNLGSVVDEYDPSITGIYTEAYLGSWSPSSTNNKLFRFTVTGKNASSSSYAICFDYIRLSPQ